MRRKERPRITIEWARRPDNIGVFMPWPPQILAEYIGNRRVLAITEPFFLSKLESVTLLDVSVLLCAWWEDSRVLAARSSWFQHPVHHSSEYIFDTHDRRIKVVVRQPDVDGQHWKTSHIHLIRGWVDSNDPCNILNVDFNEHVALFRQEIPGKYVCKSK